MLYVDAKPLDVDEELYRSFSNSEGLASLDFDAEYELFAVLELESRFLTFDILIDGRTLFAAEDEECSFSLGFITRFPDEAIILCDGNDLVSCDESFVGVCLIDFRVAVAADVVSFVALLSLTPVNHRLE